MSENPRAFLVYFIIGNIARGSSPTFTAALAHYGARIEPLWLTAMKILLRPYFIGNKLFRTKLHSARAAIVRFGPIQNGTSVSYRRILIVGRPVSLRGSQDAGFIYIEISMVRLSRVRPELEAGNGPIFPG